MAYRNRQDESHGGAEHLARIHGTEEDKVNCPFYFKIGACRHGDKCSRQHHRPPFSPTVLIQHMWQNPFTAALLTGDSSQLDETKVQENVRAFKSYIMFYLRLKFFFVYSMNSLMSFTMRFSMN